jgi:hypothetical protein
MGICIGTAKGQVRPSRMAQDSGGDSWGACPGQGDWGRPSGWFSELSFCSSKSYILTGIRRGLCRHSSSRIQAPKVMQVREGRTGDAARVSDYELCRGRCQAVLRHLSGAGRPHHSPRALPAGTGLARGESGSFAAAIQKVKAAAMLPQSKEVKAAAVPPQSKARRL